MNGDPNYLLCKLFKTSTQWSVKCSVTERCHNSHVVRPDSGTMVKVMNKSNKVKRGHSQTLVLSGHGKILIYS